MRGLSGSLIFEAVFVAMVFEETVAGCMLLAA